jgi:putative ABC transport system permease protein
MFRRFFGRSQRERDLDDEIRFHLEQEAQLHRERGAASEAAVVQARREFGSVVLVKEVTRSMWTWTSIERILRDLRVARRSLARSPGYVAVVIVTLTLGIGATTALFTVVNAILLRPLRFAEPDRLVMVWERTPFSRADGSTNNVVQTQNYLDWRARNKSFEAIAAFHALPMNVSGPVEPEQVAGLRVTSEFFDVLRVAPQLGRTFRRGEDVARLPLTTVLTHRFWQERYASNPQVIGQHIAINGVPYEIVGVLPAGFAVPRVQAEIFVPLQIDPAAAPRDGRNFSTVARLRPGVSLALAKQDMAAIAAQTAVERPVTNANWSATVVPLIEQTVGEIRRPLIVLFAAVLCVLLVACANIANLSLMRAAARSREMTVRLALGAGRSHLVHQLMTESLVLAGIGGGLGLLMAVGGVRTMVSMFPATFPLPRAGEIGVDWRVLLFTAFASVSAAAAFGIAPAVRSRGSLIDHLQGGSRSVSAANSRVRAVLVIGQVAVAVVLVMAAGLMVRSLVHLYQVDLGFRPERVLTMRMLVMRNPNDREPPSAARFATRVDSILERVRAIPEVTAVGSIHFLPMSGLDAGTGYYRADRPVPPPGQQSTTAVSVVTPGYFQAMSIRMRAGRELDSSDRFGGPLSAVVNQAFVKKTFPGEEPLGHRFKLQWSGGRPGELPEFEIVGVADDTHHDGPKTAPDPRVFVANGQVPNAFASLVVRTAGDPLRIAAAVRRAVQEVNPAQGVSNVERMETVIAESIAIPRIQTVLMTTFGALALVVACVGLYGVLSYAVEQRRHEMGLRLALGARAGSVLRLVLFDGLKLTAIGLAGGLAAGVAATRVLQTLLFEVQPTDPVVLSGVALLLLTISGAACYVPSLRATRVDPATVLRDE